MTQRFLGLACLLVYILTSFSSVLAQPGTIRGTVVDAQSGRPVPYASVSAVGAQGAKIAWALTDTLGSFKLVDLPLRTCSLLVGRLGFDDHYQEDVLPGDERPSLEIKMAPSPIVMSRVLVTASRRRETGLRTPTSATVLRREQLAESVGLTPVDATRLVPGVDLASKGLIQHTFAVRGSRSVSSAAFLMLTDYRYAALPSLGLNIPYLMSLASEDIARIEVTRGPAAALYGPDTDRGVLHIITRSPFDLPGSNLSVSVGERSLAQMMVRHAGLLSERLAFKVSAEYLRADDWRSSDSEEERLALDPADPTDPFATRIGQRDFRIERAAGEARIDWHPRPGTSLVMTGGHAQAINNIDLSATAGAVQVQDWEYSHIQVQARHQQLFANVMFNRGDSGDTYFLRNGQPLIDRSRLWAIQLQHGGRPAPRLKVTYGVDGRVTQPRTGGTIHGRNEDNDTMSEIGGYAHATSTLDDRLDLIAALRLDYHDRLNDAAVSPRAGVVYRPKAGHALRLVYNRAFNSPSAVDLFVDLTAGNAGDFPIKLASIPQGGLSFPRDENDSLVMQTAEGGAAVPADAVEAWSTVVDIFSESGINISDIPEPTAAEVATVLRGLDWESGTFTAVDEGDVQDLDPLRRKITNVVELGYKGIMGERATVGVDLYFNSIENDTGQLFAATPNVFFDPATLLTYLQQYRSSEESAELVELLAALPVGTIAPAEAGGSPAILLLPRQGGSYQTWGVDVSCELRLSKHFWAAGSYSWVSDNTLDDVEAIGDLVLGVPRNKGAMSLGYRNAQKRFQTSLHARAVEGFPVENGVYRGSVDSYFAIDLDVGYTLPSHPRVRFTLTGRNVLDNRHTEFVGAGELGRMILGRVTIRL